MSDRLFALINSEVSDAICDGVLTGKKDGIMKPEVLALRSESYTKKIIQIFYDEHKVIAPVDVIPIPPEHQKWEYHTIQMGSTNDLNKAGAEGWELVTITLAKNHSEIFAIFKRPVN